MRDYLRHKIIITHKSGNKQCFVTDSDSDTISKVISEGGLLPKTVKTVDESHAREVQQGKDPITEDYNIFLHKKYLKNSSIFIFSTKETR